MPSSSLQKREGIGSGGAGRTWREVERPRPTTRSSLKDTPPSLLRSISSMALRSLDVTSSVAPSKNASRSSSCSSATVAVGGISRAGKTRGGGGGGVWTPPRLCHLAFAAQPPRQSIPLVVVIPGTATALQLLVSFSFTWMEPGSGLSSLRRATL